MRVEGAELPVGLLSGHVLLDDFNGYSAGATTAATGGVWNAEFVGTANSNIIDADPGHGQALQTLGGAAWQGAERSLSGTDAAVRVGETKTFFWQIKPSYTSDGPGWDYDFMMGLSPDVSNINDINAWSDFAVMPFINNEATTPYINALAPGTYWAPMNPNEWYNVWVVVNNGGTNPTYDLYYSTGAGDAVLVAADANWRGSEGGIGPGVDLNAIGFMAAGNAGTAFLVDNIYYILGESTANPLNQTPTLVGETLTIGGDFTLQSIATLAIDLAETAYDVVDVTGAAKLDGLLSVTLDPSYTPNLNDVFTVLTASSLTSNLTLGGPDGALFSLAASTATELILTAISGLEGDYNNDGVVDAADYTVWRDNVDEPPGKLFNDFKGVAVGQVQYLAWRSSFGMAIPTPATAPQLSPAPEPHSAMLLLMSLSAAWARSGGPVRLFWLEQADSYQSNSPFHTKGYQLCNAARSQRFFHCFSSPASRRHGCRPLILRPQRSRSLCRSISRQPN